MSNQKQQKKNGPRLQQKTVPLIQPMSVAAAQKAASNQNAPPQASQAPARPPASSKTTPSPTVSPTLTNATKDAPKSEKGESSFSFRPLILGLIAGLAIAAGVTAYRARARLALPPPMKPDTVATASSEPEHETAIAFGVSRGAASAPATAPSASSTPPPAQTFAEAVPPPTSQAARTPPTPVASAAPSAAVTSRPRPPGGYAQANNGPKPEEPKKPPPQPQQPASVDSLLQQQLKSTIP